MSTKVLMVGFFQEALELAEECGCEVIGCMDRVTNDDCFPVPVLGNDESLSRIMHLLVGVKAFITPDQPAARRRLHGQYSAAGISFASLVSPQSRVSKSAKIGEGVFIQWRAHISSGVRLGRFVRLNVGANVMHDVTVGDFTTIAPNACVLGGVQIGSGCYIGANSTILPNVSIGEGSIVGAGAVVTRNVPSNVVVAGNPARLLRTISDQTTT